MSWLHTLTSEQSSDLQYRVEIVEPGWQRVVAACTHHEIAHAAYEAAARTYPKNRIILRQGARVMAGIGSE